MDLGLRGKTAIITGASQGIGREIARMLHAEGVAIVMVSQTAGTLQQAARGIAGDQEHGHTTPIYPIAADLGLLAEVERVAHESIERLGQVDILVNNAARALTGDFFKMPDAELEEAWQVKGLGYARMVRAIAPHMMARRAGEIINVVGITARTPTTDFIAGSMVNAALLNFTRGISRVLARYEVRVNAISPGWTLTERQARSFEMQAATRHLSANEIERQESRAIPLNRLVTTQEIARLAVFLAAGLFPAMTGAELVIDGGAANSL